MLGSAGGGVSPIVVILAIVVLGGLDLLGAILAKEWTGGASTWWFAAGAVSFLLLFGVYAHALRVAELSTVTFGWVVALQVGVLLVERLRYGVDLPSGKWVAILAIIVLQAYLILGPSTSNRAEPAPRPPSVATSEISAHAIEDVA